MPKIWNDSLRTHSAAVLILLLLTLGATLSHAQTPSWTQLSVVGSPPLARASASAVYTGTDNRLIVFGGHTGFANLNDVWTLSNANGLGGPPSWAQLNPVGSLPVGRAGHTAVL
jgi:Galactose oxidase, central domain